MTSLRMVARVVALLLVLASVVSARADDEAPRTLVRARLDPPGAAEVGANVRLVVDVLTTTFFTGAPRFPTLELPGAVVALSDAHAEQLHDEIDGVAWFGLSRAYLVTPTQPGDLAIPPLNVTLFPGPGTNAVVVRTPALTLAVATPVRPPGAEEAIGATRLTVTQHLDRATTGLRVGDAVKRTIAIAADGARGMLLPPPTFPDVAGLAVYPDQPDVEDVADERSRGFLGGRRVDAATYVVQTAGTYVLPPVSVTWWDTQAQRVRTASVPEVRFVAAAAPADAAPALALPHEERPRVRVGTVVRVAAGVLAVALAWLVVVWTARGMRALAAVRAKRRRQREASEPVAFACVRTAALADDPRATDGAVASWLARFRPGDAVTLARLCDLSGDAELRAEADVLARQLYGAPAPSWSGKALLADLERVRARLAARAAEPTPPLPPLNPA